MEFSWPEYWSGLPFPSSGDLPNAGMEPVSLTYPALAAGFFTTGANKPRQCIKKQRHHIANKGLYNQSYGFSSSHVWL